MGTLFLLLCGAVMGGCIYEWYTDSDHYRNKQPLRWKTIEELDQDREEEYKKLKRDADRAIEEFNSNTK